MLRADEYLTALLKEAGKSLPPREAAALVAEVEDHLHQSIQARLELGDDLQAAQAAAANALGPAPWIVRRETAVRRGRWHTPALVALTVSGAACLPLALAQSGTAFSIALLPFGIAGVAFTAACETKRPLRPLVASVLAFGLLSTGLLAVLCAPYCGVLSGRGMLRGNARFFAANAAARARRQARYAEVGWPSLELERRTELDRALFAKASEEARRAANAVDLARSASWSLGASVLFAMFLGLLNANGAWCQWLSARGSRWTRWNPWRAE